jgi:porin
MSVGTHLPLTSMARVLAAVGARRRAALGFASALATACLAGAACADEIAPAAPGSAAPASSQPAAVGAATTAPSTAPSATSAGPFGFLSAPWDSPNLLGDLGGVRPALSKAGITLNISENAEVFGNLTGGVQQGFEVNGLTTVTLQLDTQKAFGLNGGLFNVSGLHIWGGDLSATNLYALQFASGIEADGAVRLWELWYQQNFGDRFDIKIGEQSLDNEFKVSQYGAYFLNAAMGWPLLPTENLPGGGPGYPLAALGVRARAFLTDNVHLLAGVFNGSPIPRDSPNTQLSNPNGVSFPLNTGVFAISESQITWGSDASTNAGFLPGLLKIGGWYDSYHFDDLQYDNEGVPLASPKSNGIPAVHHGDYAFYAGVDQTIWRSKEDTNHNINVFIRPMFTPLQDRNLISFSVDGGLTLHEPFEGRSDDTFGLGMGVGRVSNSASGYDKDLVFNEPAVYTPVRGTETFLEATYQLQAAKWWQIQPDIQYFFNPGAGLANPNDPTQKIKNELLIGLRTNITF